MVSVEVAVMVAVLVSPALMVSCAGVLVRVQSPVSSVLVVLMVMVSW